MSKTKKAEVFGMSFSMIFSILLMVFFIIIAFIGIRYFINYQKEIQIGLYVQDLQNDVDNAWNAEKTTLIFNSTLPSNFAVNYICAIDFSNAPINASNVDIGIYDNIKHSISGYSVNKNIYFYSSLNPYVLKSFNIKHLTLAKRNPICFKVVKNRVSIKIIKNQDSALVELA